MLFYATLRGLPLTGMPPMWMHYDDGGGICERGMLAALLGPCLVIKYARHTPVILLWAIWMSLQL